LIFLGFLYPGRGESEKALEYLQPFAYDKPIELRMIIILEEFPRFQDLQSDPTFQQILGKLRARWEDEHDILENWFDENDSL
jgi:hypothetical protein